MAQRIFFILSILLFVKEPVSALVKVPSTSCYLVDIYKDSTKLEKKKKLDSLLATHNPRIATFRSAILPGWGQAYNRQYWKIPIVYGALGATAGVFTYNLAWYKRTRFAYKVAITKDTASFGKVHAKLKSLLTDSYGAPSLKYYRDSYRRDIDYSFLFFLGLWGLNVVDATVYAHLKQFDISPNLSMHIQPGMSPMAGTAGMSVVFNIGKRK